MPQLQLVVYFLLYRQQPDYTLALQLLGLFSKPTANISEKHI